MSKERFSAQGQVRILKFDGNGNAEGDLSLASKEELKKKQKLQEVMEDGKSSNKVLVQD